MKTILTIILAAMTFITAGAYKYSYTFDNVPVSEAIVKISKDNPDVNISFIYKELDRYRTHARVRTDHAFDALRSVVGIHPISIIRRGDNYYIEAMQRGITFCAGVWSTLMTSRWLLPWCISFRPTG